MRPWKIIFYLVLGTLLSGLAGCTVRIQSGPTGSAPISRQPQLSGIDYDPPMPAAYSSKLNEGTEKAPYRGAQFDCTPPVHETANPIARKLAHYWLDQLVGKTATLEKVGPAAAGLHGQAQGNLYRVTLNEGSGSKTRRLLLVWPGKLEGKGPKRLIRFDKISDKPAPLMHMSYWGSYLRFRVLQE